MRPTGREVRASVAYVDLIELWVILWLSYRGLLSSGAF